jgi:hypothetical protein
MGAAYSSSADCDQSAVIAGENRSRVVLTCVEFTTCRVVVMVSYATHLRVLSNEDDFGRAERKRSAALW